MACKLPQVSLNSFWFLASFSMAYVTIFSSFSVFSAKISFLPEFWFFLNQKIQFLTKFVVNFPVMCITSIAMAMKSTWQTKNIRTIWKRRWNCCRTSSATWRNTWLRLAVIRCVMLVTWCHVFLICTHGSELHALLSCTWQMDQFK